MATLDYVNGQHVVLDDAGQVMQVLTESSPIIPVAGGGTTPAGAPVTQGALNVTYGPGGGALLTLPPSPDEQADTGRTSGLTGGGYTARDYSPRAPYSGGGGYRGGPAVPQRTATMPGQSAGGGADSLRPTISSDAGSAGPWGASVFGGAGVSGGTPRVAPSTLNYFNPQADLSQTSVPDISPGSGAGGGGTHPLYAALRAKGDAMAAKVRGMASGIGSGGGYSSGGSSYGGSTSTSTGGPGNEPMRGFARGMDPEQAAGLAMEPTFLLPKLFPGLSGASPLYRAMEALPAAQLAILAKRGSDQGPSDFTNALAGIYGDAATTGNLPGTGRMLRTLTNPGKGLEQMFTGTPVGAAPKGTGESYTDPGYAYGMEPLSASESVYQFAPLLDAALINLPSWTRSTLGSTGYGGYLMDKWGSKALRKPPEKTKYIGQYVGRRLLR